MTKPLLRPSPERQLWGAALALFIADARFYIESDKPKAPHHKEAFDDLCFCGSITKRLCEKADTDPVWLSERFRCYARKNLNKED
jgi:hypothetical protein